jgi:hypothetical protein
VGCGLAQAQDAYTTWQSNYFGCTTCTQAAGTADPLGKGTINTNQFMLGLNPTNSASIFRIISLVRTGNNILVTWKAGGGKTNALQVTSGRADGSYSNNFHDIISIILTGSGDVTTNYTDVGAATNAPTRLYRIRLAPAPQVG